MGGIVYINCLELLKIFHKSFLKRMMLIVVEGNGSFALGKAWPPVVGKT